MTKEDRQAFGDVKGTSAYSVQQEKNWAAAVELWKQGFAIFGTELPPKFEIQKETQAPNKPYNTDQALSFISLYNPKEHANVECVFVSCPEKQSSSGADIKAASSLICLSHPPALVDGQFPYTYAIATPTRFVFPVLELKG